MKLTQIGTFISAVTAVLSPSLLWAQRPDALATPVMETQKQGKPAATPQIIKGDSIKADGTGAVQIVSNGHGCSGTLLTNQWAITAQHCQLDINAPQNISISMGSQTSVGAYAVGHPSLDFALVRLARAFTMNGSTTGYQVPIFTGATSALQGQTVRVWGYGCNAYSSSNSDDCSGFDGTLREGYFRVAQAPVDDYSFSLTQPNSKGQSLAPGDSGSGAFVKTAQGWALAGVFKGPAEGRPENWRDWAMAYVNGTPIPLPKVWFVYTSPRPTFLMPPLPNNYTDSYSWNVCPGSANYSYSPAFKLEDGKDFISIKAGGATVQLTGQGSTTCRGSGPITVSIRTNASNQSTGLTAMPVMCNYTGPSSELPMTGVGPGLAAAANNIYFFVTTTGNQVMYQRAESGQAGLCWQQLGGRRETNTSPAAGSVGTHVFVAVKGLDGKLYLNQADLGQPFGQWFPMNFDTDTAPAVAGVGNNVYFFAKSLDGRVFYNRGVVGQAGAGWKEVEGGARITSAPAAGSVGTHVFVAAKGLDGKLYLNQADLGQPFGQWFPMNFDTDTAPAVAGVGNNVYFFAKSLDGRVFYNRGVVGQAGAGWKEVEGGARITSAPAAVSVGTHVFVAAKGLDGKLYLNQADLGQPFGQWFPMN